MRERFMLTAYDRSYLRGNLTRKRVDYVLDLVEEQSLYLKFLESVQSETTHLGHGYVKALLQGTYYCSDEDLHKASDIQREIESNMSKMMDIDLPSLTPLLCSQFLLTQDERTLLTSKSEVQNQDVFRFFDILETKGPLGYLKFVQCLSQQLSHPAHSDLYGLLCQTTDDSELALAVDRPTKRTPNRLSMGGALVKKKYKQLFARIKEDLYNGDWIAVERGVDECMQSESPEVRVVGLLEEASSLALRNCIDGTKALTIISKAKELCKTQVSGSNATFLSARAENKLSGIYRYLKQNDKALECVEKAKVLLFNAEQGQDSANANYNHACALVAKSCWSDAPRVMSEFNFAVDVGLHDQSASCSSYKWPQIVVDKSLIQQAMFLLDSNKNVPCITDKTRQKNITTASSSLSKMDVPSLSNRIKCLYYLAESELHTQRKEVDCAIKAASDARTLATECGFAHLLHSANAKLLSL